MAREPLSKKLRFEVFKRDSFTCQYCGRKAPEIVLVCDHVKPVADGGTNDILNLVASCFECNAGKGARRLSDQSVITKQVDQLAELQERREQIDMMMQWRDELQNIATDAVEAIASRFPEFTPNEAGKADIRKWLKKYSAAEIITAVDDAFSSYLEYVGDKATPESWNRAFAKIPAFLSIQRQEQEKPYIRRLIYIQGIIRKRAKWRHYDCIAYLEHVHLCGMSLDEIESRAKGMRKLEDFEGPIDQWLASIGKAF
jgi:hypothetical protein